MRQKQKKEGGESKAASRSNPVEAMDLTIRIRNDGGPLFSFLAAIEDAHARGDRIRQLLYLGLLREREITGVHDSVAHSGGVSASVSAHTPIAKSPSVAEKNRHATTSNEPAFEADDLAAIFQ